MKKRFLCVLMLLSVVISAFSYSIYGGSDLPFTDVDSSQWYIDAVIYTYKNSLFTGTSETTFSPSATMTRAMIVTVLYRMSGSPAVEGKRVFSDIPDGTWYTDAVEWAYDNRIVNGVDETRFAPSDPITREQLATIVFRYAEFSGYNLSSYHSLGCFLDKSDINDYATSAFHWAVGRGMISGISVNMLSPKSGATRAQVATILMRFAYCYDSDPSNDPVPISDSIVIDEGSILKVGETRYYIGMSLDELVLLSGQPEERLSAVRGYTW